MSQYDPAVISFLQQRNAPLTPYNYKSVAQLLRDNPQLAPNPALPAGGDRVAEPSPSDRTYDGGLDVLGQDAPPRRQARQNTGQQKSAPASPLPGARAMEGGTPGARAIDDKATAKKDDDSNPLLLLPGAAPAAAAGRPRVEPTGPTVPGDGAAPRGVNDNSRFNPPAADEFAMQRQNAMDGEVIPPSREMQRSSVAGAIDHMIDGESMRIDENAPRIGRQGASVNPNVQDASRAMTNGDISRIDDTINMPRTTGEVVLPDTPKQIADYGAGEPRVVPGAGPQQSVIPNPDNAPGGRPDIRDANQRTPSVTGRLSDRMDLKQLQQAYQTAKNAGNAAEAARVGREITALMRLFGRR